MVHIFEKMDMLKSRYMARRRQMAAVIAVNNALSLLQSDKIRVDSAAWRAVASVRDLLAGRDEEEVLAAALEAALADTNEALSQAADAVSAAWLRAFDETDEAQAAQAWAAWAKAEAAWAALNAASALVIADAASAMEDARTAIVRAAEAHAWTHDKTKEAAEYAAEEAWKAVTAFQADTLLDVLLQDCMVLE